MIKEIIADAKMQILIAEFEKDYVLVAKDEGEYKVAIQTDTFKELVEELKHLFQFVE